MGWGSLLGDFAKGFAKGYVSERGVMGALEDVGELASSAKNFFSGSSKSATAETWEQITDFISNEVQEGNYANALQSLDEYYQEYENSEADVYYYYWRALVLINWLESIITEEDEFKEVGEALQEAIREGRKFNDSEINKEFKEIKNRQNQAQDSFQKFKNWSDMQEDFNKALKANQAAHALEILDNFYTKYENGRLDYFYYSDKFKASISLENNREPDADLDKQLNEILSFLSTLKECLKGMEATEDNPSEDQLTTINECKNFIETVNNVAGRTKCDLALRDNDFAKAKSIIEKEFKFTSEKDYTNGLSRIASLQLVYMVDSKEQSVQCIEDAICRAEEALRKATEKDDNPDTKRERINIVTDRIEIGKKYLVQLKGNNESSNKGKATESNNELEYIEEIKACLAEDGIINDRERRLLNKLRLSLGISEERARQLEETYTSGMTEEEKEYLVELKECLTDGCISDKERRLLNRLRQSLNISVERATELEKGLNL